MNAPVSEPKRARASFRAKLLVAMMLVVSAITALSLYLVQRNAAAGVERDLQRDFQSELASLHTVQEVRHAALAERCRALVRKARIHAALEDNALDLLYPSAKDELRDVVDGGDEESPDIAAHALRARFYRFLDAQGAVIPAPDAEEAGTLKPEEEAQLTLPAAPDKQQIGYLVHAGDDGSETVDEVIVMPIFSTQTGDVIAALALGFRPVELRERTGMKSGIWVNGRLHLQSLAQPAQASLSAELSRAIAAPDRAESSFAVQVDGAPHLLFYKRLNPDSHFPPAYEVCVYPLADALARQRQMRWQIVGAGALLLLGGLAASHLISGRFSVPVEKLAVDSEQHRSLRERAEAALQTTSKELQRSARFSADASHQLKTPVTVMRAGLESLLTQENLTTGEREEIASLIHQTYRLASIIEDLLLLSRMDAGRLQLDLKPVNLTELIEALVDDLNALPDPLNVEVDADCPTLEVVGEKRYVTLILQNLFENARKYNRPGGRIRIICHEAGDSALVSVGNTGPRISPAAREHIFERFHRGAVGENVPGHGLGLNLARELARLHGGELRLVRSEEDWTEFEVRFRLAKATQAAAALVNATEAA